MAIRKQSFALDEFYHLYNRGNSKQVIFRGKKDYERFTALLYGINTDERFNFYNQSEHTDIYSQKQQSHLVYIGAYCLMPNHFHLLITPAVENGVSLFMQKLLTAYVMYFNKRYKRTGSLFEGKFKSEHAGTDRYLKYLFAYIHLNPVKLIFPKWKEKGIPNKKQALDYLRTYNYSSLLNYLGNIRIENTILHPKKFPRYFGTPKDSINELTDWLSYPARQDLAI